MKPEQTKEPEKSIELEYDIDEPPQKVWRAISIPEFREIWLPEAALANPEATSLTPEREICYTVRDSDQPNLQSVVTFRISPNETGGTHLRIIHELTGMCFPRGILAAANVNDTPSLLAA